MQKLIAVSLLLFSFGLLQAQSTKYRVEIDLTATDDDQVPVIMYPPYSDAQFVEFHMAKVVPGTYSISDFGRFIVDFQATDSLGNALVVEKTGTNRWKVANGGKLHKLSYKVHDSFDEFDGYKENYLFEPGGTSIEKKEKVYVINTFGFVGYIDGQKFAPYELKVTHDESIYGATALKRKSYTAAEDIFEAADFNFLADGPIMYNVPDTTSRQIANATVLVSVYSPNNVLSSQDVMDNITDLMEAQSQYLGGELPVDRYAYLIYLYNKRTLSGSGGALEHSYSSVYSLPEASADRIGQTVRDVAAHEFFHIVTPLNIHSEEIGNFDYINPKMSEHLWLYEGVTEYSSMHVQVKHGLFGLDKFLDEIQQKLFVADRFAKEVSFTEMSRRILEPEFEPMYSNVYYKGALIGMCLDLYLLKYSNGEKDLQWLLRELAKKYGKEVSFKDAELFDVIESLTFPEIREFLDTYVAGKEPLPIQEVLSWVGIIYAEELAIKEITLGNFRLGLNEDREIVVGDLKDANKFAKDLKLVEGDVIIQFNGKDFTLRSAQDVMTEFKETTQPGDKVKVLVRREQKGKLKEKTLKAKALQIDTTEKHVLELIDEPTNEQARLLKIWTQTSN